MKRTFLLSVLTLCAACAIQKTRAQFSERPLSPDPGFSLRSELLQPVRYGSAPSDPLRFSSPWRYGELGLFCKLDVVFERSLKFPVLFRLGDVNRVEAWEGKGAWRSVY